MVTEWSVSGIKTTSALSIAQYRYGSWQAAGTSQSQGGKASDSAGKFAGWFYSEGRERHLWRELEGGRPGERQALCSDKMTAQTQWRLWRYEVRIGICGRKMNSLFRKVGVKCYGFKIGSSKIMLYRIT